MSAGTIISSQGTKIKLYFSTAAPVFARADDGQRIGELRRLPQEIRFPKQNKESASKKVNQFSIREEVLLASFFTSENCINRSL